MFAPYPEKCATCQELEGLFFCASHISVLAALILSPFVYHELQTAIHVQKTGWMIFCGGGAKETFDTNAKLKATGKKNAP